MFMILPLSETSPSWNNSSMIHGSFYSQYLNMGVYVDIESTTIEIYVLQKAETVKNPSAIYSRQV